MYGLNSYSVFTVAAVPQIQSVANVAKQTENCVLMNQVDLQIPAPWLPEAAWITS